MRIRVRIDRLVLDGLPVEKRHAAIVQEAVETELGRLLAEGRIDPGLYRGEGLSRLSGGSITVSPEATPSAIGSQIGQAIHRSITP